MELPLTLKTINVLSTQNFDDGYGKISGTADIDKDGILDAFDTNTALFGST
jgi:hypothetical protein